ncbi:hypothetical protein MesoLjLb_22860 [Mesorhizobium sp. L-8-3]|nr:hypothetical protein MesoLjLb_22860 [Mesorhizobium sp. L-8-3]
MREWILSPAKEDLVDDSWDVYKDMWNNEVGRRIGFSAVDDQALIEAIKDAWRRGDLIAIRTDGRIPKNYRSAFLKLGRPALRRSSPVCGGHQRPVAADPRNFLQPIGSVSAHLLPILPSIS